MKVVVIGAGFAGMAAAVHLQERRHDVLLVERRGVLGGRATSFRDAVSGGELDNGSHLMVGAYEATLDLVRRAGASELLRFQDELALEWLDERGWARLRCPPVAAPLHLLAGLVGLRVPWRARLQALRLGLHVRFSQPPAGATLAEWFERTGQGPEARRLLWDPLCTAIFNDAPERTAAALFQRVYRETFLRSHRASRLVFLRRGWGELHERLARYFEGRGGRLLRRATVEAIEFDGGRAAAVRYVQRAQTRDEIRRGRPSAAARAEADAVVAAVPWSALPGLLPEALRDTPPFAALRELRPAPIVSIEMWLDRRVVDRAMVGLRGGEIEWVFDKGLLHDRPGPPQHLSFIISAAFRAHPRPNGELVAAAEAALRRVFPAMEDARVLRSLVLREPEATFVPDPSTEALRPGATTPVAGLYLAGDWTATGLPATIEGAVRSGRTAAAAVDATARP
jgi:squalene-associated FAD-dependent desaturase